MALALRTKVVVKAVQILNQQIPARQNPLGGRCPLRIQVFLLIEIVGNLAEKSLDCWAILAATVRAIFW